MSNIQKALNEMAVRIARREVNSKVRPLEKKIKELKFAVRLMQKLVDRQEKAISALSKNPASDEKIEPLPAGTLENSRLSPKLISVLRKKLKLSRNLFGKLLGVTSNTVFMWEYGRSRPRPEYRARIISLRKLGKRKIRAILKG